ncbi:flavin monoamine oxidase family protein [Sphingomonas bacterium]|uniref:flavin monoamine oxidase family protein n=1 Tax=Sphingomonas bacterium TaxID=1895847 RepID=UPI0015750FA8|nr:FAD-dependent oxidoreductase [Sphingomonas bacterium]
MPLSRRSFLSAVGSAGGYGAAFSAMQALGLLATAEASPLPALPGDHGKGRRIVIIGAGAAGLTSAWELRKAGYDVLVLEANGRVGGRAWAARPGTEIRFMDGTVQRCDWQPGQWFNMGPARIPSIHRNLLGYCSELKVPLEVEINASRSALMQAPELNGGKPVTQRRVVFDTKGYIAELLTKAIDGHALDQALTREDVEKLRALLVEFGQLDPAGKYSGGDRGGFAVNRGAGPATSKFYDPLALHELLAADLTKGEFYEDHIDWQATMFQPVGGMDQIWFAFQRALGPIVRTNAPVQEISNTARGVRVAYKEGGVTKLIDADACICTIPVSQIKKMPGNLSPATKAAAASIPIGANYKIAWQSPRFWETDTNIYGGISFLKREIDLVWYPSYGLFSPTGVLLSGFGMEGTPGEAELNAFGKLPTAEKFALSRKSVDILHPGRGKLLEKPIFMSWRQIPYFEGGIAANMTGPGEGQGELRPAYTALNAPDGNVWFAGDYLSRIVGWQEGAILSGHRAIAEITGKLPASSKPLKAA